MLTTSQTSFSWIKIKVMSAVLTFFPFFYNQTSYADPLPANPYTIKFQSEAINDPKNSGLLPGNNKAVVSLTNTDSGITFSGYSYTSSGINLQNNFATFFTVPSTRKFIVEKNDINAPDILNIKLNSKIKGELSLTKQSFIGEKEGFAEVKATASFSGGGWKPVVVLNTMFLA